MQTDVAVIGAGPAGLAFARALDGTGLDVTLIDPQPAAMLADPPFDGREIALTHHSMAVLERLGAWARIPAGETAPLRAARVLNGAGHRSLIFDGAADGRPLGRLVPNHLIRRALHDAVREQTSATILDGLKATGIRVRPHGMAVDLEDGRALTARLVVAADTRFSKMREARGIQADQVDFGKTMLVCRMNHDQVDHGGVATEWFGHGQTVALLPLGGRRSSVVLTLPHAEIARLTALDPVAFADEIMVRLDGRLGRLQLESTRHGWPLVAVQARRFVGHRFALIGDAAVGMHPVTAHGFNLGLKSAERLADGIARAARTDGDIASPLMLHRYEAGHKLTAAPLWAATNAIVGLYTRDDPAARLARRAVMDLGRGAAPVRRAISALLMDGGREIGRAARLSS
ncbi:5-demethoxyubiquinol-8 5-hydroxylase UbiM [Tistrella mobilis]|uniref:5-demethoxyubiquinol-8 5-hydroxylase UbiM n=1 Tax=Tistrella mobilis TaxID=171437 RepID=UPI003556F427